MFSYRCTIKAAVTDEIFHKEYFLDKFSLQEKFCLDKTNSLQVRIPILSKEVGCLF